MASYRQPDARDADDEAGTMRALVKEGRSVAVVRAPIAGVAGDEVRVRVHAAGVCRTDLYVARGRIPSRDPVVLGHEGAGVVEAVGGDVRDVAVGARVTLLPSVSCGRCRECRAGADAVCARASRLGVERHGVFAEQVVVPARALRQLPPGMSFRLGAYVEPVAAALAPTTVALPPGARGLVVGSGRIARLTERVLRARGLDVRRVSPAPASRAPGEVVTAAAGVADVAEAAVDDGRAIADAGAVADDGPWDFAVECEATDAVMHLILAALRPRGTAILKSRSHARVALDVGLAVRKELLLRAVTYGSFDEAIALLASGALPVDDLLGESFPLERFADAFDAAEREVDKPFFALAPAPPGSG